MQLLNKPLHGRLVAFQMSFDTAIRAIAYPAADAQRYGLLGGPGTEEYALDGAGNSDADRNPGHQTTLMSGASSAFMPTTL